MTEINTTPSPSDAGERPVRVSVEAGVARILLDRKPVNAFNFAFYGQMTELLAELAARDDLGVLLIGSAIDKVFSAGADINDFKAVAAKPDSGEVREAAVLGMLHGLREFPYPTVAVVDGAAVGAGCVFATLCDLRIASTRAWFSIPEIEVTRVGGGHHVRRLLPEGVMRRLFFAAERLSAERAYQLGFVEELTEPDQLWTAADRLGASIAAKSRIGLRLSKKALNGSEDLALWEGYGLEQQYSFRLGRLDADRLLKGPEKASSD
jgi:enoyl-CoA hydratase/carnithine racemase